MFRVAPVQRFRVAVLVESDFERPDLAEIISEGGDRDFAGADRLVAAVELQRCRECLVVEILNCIQPTLADGEHPLLPVLPHYWRMQEADVTDRLYEFE